MLCHLGILGGPNAKRGQKISNGYLTPAFSRAQKRAECYATRAFARVPNAKCGEKIRSGSLTPAFSWARRGRNATSRVHARGSANKEGQN